MTPHQIKEGFLALPPRARRDMALWIIQTEFSDPAQAGEETSESVQAALTRGRQSGGVSTHSAPSSPVILKALVAVLALLLVLMLAYFLTKPKDSRPVGADKTAELKALAEEEAREAARPESPTNLTYLEQRIGKEVTLRGVPKSAEVGYLHFHTDPTKGVRVKLISGGVVVYQSTDLEQWVQSKQEIEVRGILQRHEDGFLEIPIDRQVQIKLFDPTTPAPDPPATP